MDSTLLDKAPRYNGPLTPGQRIMLEVASHQGIRQLAELAVRARRLNDSTTLPARLKVGWQSLHLECQWIIQEHLTENVELTDEQAAVIVRLFTTDYTGG